MSHPEFGSPGQAPGMEIWRIENMIPAAIDKKEYGCFYEGDSYIVLVTKQVGSGFDYDLFFWLGGKSSQDERGACAYKTVELDDTLGGRPVQFREVQGSESPQFLAAFKDGVTYMEGEFAKSAFRHVERDQWPTRLMHVKGKRRPKVQQVSVACASLNAGDSFILDAGLDIFCWNGSEANRYEKRKAADVAQRIKDEERGGRAVIHPIDQGNEPEEFWNSLGGKGSIASADSAGADDASEMPERGTIKCLKLSDADGDLQVTEVGSNPLKRDTLDTNDVFVVDGGNQVFVWVGKGASSAERKNAIVEASKYVQKDNRDVSVSRVIEDNEPGAFADLFSDWYAVGMRRKQEAKKSTKVTGPSTDELSSAMITRSGQQKPRSWDDGSGTKTVYRVNNFDLEELPENEAGEFFSGDSYIVKYMFLKNGREECVLYFWLGRNSSRDEQGTAALKTVELDDQMGGMATQIRVTQGNEPAHFLSVFGDVIVHAGGIKGAFDKEDSSDGSVNGVRLYQVKGSSSMAVKAGQVTTSAANLNSGDCFIVSYEGGVDAWLGSGSSDSEKEACKRIAARLSKGGDVSEVSEGEESEDFWGRLGGKADYPNVKEPETDDGEPRLFHCSDATGAFRVEEMFDFSQDDLSADDVMMLDINSTIFVWVGSQANSKEQTKAVELAQDFAAKMGRPECPIIRVAAGQEPALFTCNFVGWDETKAKVFVDPYEAKQKALQEERDRQLAEREKQEVKPAPAPAPAAVAAVADGATYPYEDLKARKVQGVDATRLQDYLTEEEFEKVFGMTRSEFNELKGWKQKDAKKKVGLF